MAFIPAALQILPLLPGMIDSTMKIVRAVRSDPATPDAAKRELDEIAAHLDAIVERVRSVALPT